MTELKILRSALDDANVLVISLIGHNRAAGSLDNARKLCDRMHREQREGLIMDYRRCALDHNVSQFTEVAQIFEEGLPPGVRVAYVYAPENLIHAATITKHLHKAGFPARACNNFEDAAAFARGLA